MSVGVVPQRLLHPLHAIVLAFPIALFTAAVAADVAFLNSAEIQWSNFAAWLIAGALLFGAPVVLMALIGFVRRRSRGGLYLLLVAAMWLAGLVNAFRHSADGWASVGTLGLALSIVSALLALAAGWIGFSGEGTVMGGRHLAVAASLALAACGSAGDPLDQSGPTPQLPERQQALVPAIAIARPTGWDGTVPTVPEGFRIAAIATDLKVPRQMLVLPNGDILVAEGKGGNAPALRPKDVIAGYIKSLGVTGVKGGDRITLLRDADGDGTYETRTVFIDRLNAPYGLAFVDGQVYVANQDALLRFAYAEGQTRITAPGVEVTKLPSQVNHHWTKALTASADGTKLYVGIGSNSNVGERGMAIEEDRAVVWEIDRASGARRVYASGIRNPTALAVDPWRGAVWSVVNERDELGPQLVPDYLTAIRPGGFYGWPYSYWGKTVDPRIRPERPDLVAKALTPDYALGSHVAALGLSFMAAGNYAGYGDGAFVGMHGSWNRPDLSGYKVVWVPFANGRPAGKPKDFVTGFLADGKARGRPVGVTFDPRTRALLVADDLSNTVWRVTPIAQTPSPSPAAAGG